VLAPDFPQLVIPRVHLAGDRGLAGVEKRVRYTTHCRKNDNGPGLAHGLNDSGGPVNLRNRAYGCAAKLHYDHDLLA